MKYRYRYREGIRNWTIAWPSEMRKVSIYLVTYKAQD